MNSGRSRHAPARLATLLVDRGVVIPSRLTRRQRLATCDAPTVVSRRRAERGVDPGDDRPVPRRARRRQQRQRRRAARRRPPRDQLGRWRLDRDLAGGRRRSPAFSNNRGALFATPGSGFVQAPARRPGTTFGNRPMRPHFQPFSPVRLFSPVGSNVTDVHVLRARQRAITPAATRGFGAVFSDVDQPDGGGPGGKRGNRGASTLIEYYGSRRRAAVQQLRAGIAGRRQALVLRRRLRRRADRAACASRPATSRRAWTTRPGRDIVMMDDFVYGEPQALP